MVRKGMGESKVDQQVGRLAGFAGFARHAEPEFAFERSGQKSIHTQNKTGCRFSHPVTGQCTT